MDAINASSQLPSALALGAVQKAFSVRILSKWVTMIFGLLCLGGAFYFFISGITDSYYQPTDSVYFIFSGILFLFALLFLWFAYSNWKKAVIICQSGFVYRDRKGEHPWRWEEVLSFTASITRNYYNGIYTGTTYIYTITGNEGRRVILNNVIKHVKEAADIISNSIFPLLYKRLADLYNNGQAVAFGPVLLSKTAGIKVGKKDYPWDQIAQVSVEKGYVKIAKKDGGWFSGADVATASIPNLDVLFSIVNQVIGIKA